MNVSAIIVTRGNVDLDPIIETIPEEWETLVWTNGQGIERRSPPGWKVRTRGEDGSIMTYVLPQGSTYVGGGTLDLETRRATFPDVSVYGRYAAIEFATGDVIYVQDDDVIVSSPQVIVDTWRLTRDCPEHGPMVPTIAAGYHGWTCPHHDPQPFIRDEIVCNMPLEFRHDFYTDHALVGFGAAFHRDTPRAAFERFATVSWEVTPPDEEEDIHYVWEYGDRVNSHPDDRGWFNRTCDIVLTGLSPCVLVDVPKTNLDYATADDRMYRQPQHVAERARMRELVREIRDARGNG